MTKPVDDAKDALPCVPTPKGLEDARILAICTNVAGDHFRDWRDVVSAIEQFNISNWAIRGPRVIGWAFILLRRRSYPPREWWVSCCDLLASDWACPNTPHVSG